jgi:hypothetical protein
VVTFQQGPSAAVSTESGGATTSAVQVGGTTGVGQPLLKALSSTLSGDFDLAESDEEAGLSFQSVLQVFKKGLSRLSEVMDAMGRKRAAAVINQLQQMLERLGRPEANVRGAPNHEVKGANPEPRPIAPSVMFGPARALAPDPDDIDLSLWDHGIDGLLHERLPAGSQRHRSESLALGAAALLASGLVGSELNRRRPLASPWARKPRRRPAGAAPSGRKQPRSRS